MSKISLKHSGGNVVSLNSPSSAPTSADVAFKLPNADGTSGQALVTDASGNLSFANVGATGWTHVNSAAIGSVNSYTWTGIPTNTQHIIIYYDSLSADGSYYPAIQIGDSGGIETTGYESAVGYLETSYHFVSAYSTRVPLVRDNYGAANFAFKGVVNCWRQPNTNKWHFRVHSGRAANTTLFFSNAYKELSGDITQVKILLNGGSFDGGNIALSYYQD
tara:strand:+ start:188 stop:844 length:657 start_codon:yes stop_codon:yes gene_type:complete